MKPEEIQLNRKCTERQN